MFTIITDDFFLRALFAGLLTALAAAPLGCFVVWRRLAYFGDATAHSALLGVVLATALGLPLILGVAGIALFAALALGLTARGGEAGGDTLLGVLAHGTLALGLVLAAMLPGAGLSLVETLTGDILAVGPADLWLMALGTLLILGLIVWRWRPLVLATLSPDLATAEGGRPRPDTLVLTLCLALFVALSMQVVGILLITAMVILPAAAARPLARSPEGMAVIAALTGGLSVVAGLLASSYLDTPAGPSIIVAAAAFYLVAQLRQVQRAS
jgi:zinc transport system permease protein